MVFTTLELTLMFQLVVNFINQLTAANEFDVLVAAINQLQIANYKADYILLNPTDFHKILLLKDTTNNYH
jgi:hypothetical protein